MFRLSFREKALREFANVLRKDQLRINSALDELQAERWKTLNLRKIKGTTHGYRLRVGRWRILFTMIREKKNIEIVDIFMKKGDQDYRKRRRLIQ